MVLKNEILYAPLIDKECRIVTQNKIFEGRINFESKELIHITQINEENKNDNNIKKILKSSIREFNLFDIKTQKFVEINTQLLQGTLISRLKKMK